MGRERFSAVLASHQSSSSSSCGLSGAGRCYSYERAPGLMTLRSMTGGCQTNVEWCEIRFNGPEPGVTLLAQSAVPVPWQKATQALRARQWSLDGLARAVWNQCNESEMAVFMPD